MWNRKMDELNAIYAAIAASGFSEDSLRMIDDLTGKPTCIDCIVKFVNPTKI